MIIVIILLFIIALPTLLNVIASALGLFWLYDFISNYGKHILFSCILLSISLAALYPVSYTHLDVYKRQYDRSSIRPTEGISSIGYTALSIINLYFYSVI